MDRIVLKQGDCLELMKDIEDSSIDMVFADLPYGTTKCRWDVVIPFEPLWEQYERIIKPNGALVFTASQPFTSALVMSNPKMFKYEWIWEKSKASNFLNAKKNPLKAHENILIFGKKKVNYYPLKIEGKPYNKGKRKTENGYATDVYGKMDSDFLVVNKKGLRYPRSVQYFKTAESEGKYLATQKPVALVEYFIETYSKENDIVLDNVFGSCTTGIACINKNRRFLGFEKDNTNFNICEKRIKEKFNLI